ncbi:MAG: alpha/beta hydrolase-fold protein [Cyclobacteriaceae bacterium]
MRRTFTYLLLVFGLCMGTRAQEGPIVLESLSMHSEILNQEIKYSVVLPQDYHISDRTYPVIYLLHGLGGTESSWLEYGRVSQTVYQLVDQGDIAPMIYIMPQGFKTYYVNDFYGKYPYQDMFVQELVPHVDEQFRTIADVEHRGTMGYSMGGFGALILPLLNPEIFSVCAPLSISMRTDKQYMTEDASGWDDQWGRLFGGVGLMGESRLTDYYKQHSPFHIMNRDTKSRYTGLKIYIDNGDEEETLCASNEELHMLLRDIDFPHEFRVRDGGHEFAYWREAMPNALRFISDAFDGKAYRGDVKEKIKLEEVGNATLIFEDGYEIWRTKEYDQTTRQYPVMYVLGDFQIEDKQQIIQYVKNEINSRHLPPVHLVFLDVASKRSINEVIKEVNEKYRGRDGYRFRAFISCQNVSQKLITSILDSTMFTVNLMLDSPIDCDWFEKKVQENGDRALTRPWWFFATHTETEYYKNYGCTHMSLRDAGVYHEYRVTQNGEGNSWLLAQFPEALKFVQLKLHW